MFIFDFVVEGALEEVFDWIYGQMIEFFTAAFSLMDGMGVEIFTMPWVEAIVSFFSKLGWALYAVGIVVAVFEGALELENGRGSIRDVLINIFKGFFAVSLFTLVPIRLYQAAINWEEMLGKSLTGLSINDGFSMSLLNITNSLYGTDNIFSASMPSITFKMFLLIAIGYSVIKVFFANIKRGAILVIQIAVGSLYMFSVPRGYLDGFRQWIKQVLALCLTAFLQSLVLTAGLMIFRDHMILGTGTLLAATEVPRICGQFGIDTSTKVNVMSGVYAAQSAINISRSISKAVSK